MGELANGWLHDTVSAMVYALAQEHNPAALPSLQPPFNDVTSFVLRQQAHLPDYLRSPLAAATLGFDVSGWTGIRGLFHSRPPAFRQRQIRRWKQSSLRFKRDLLRYHESLATFGLYSRQVPPGLDQSPAGLEAESSQVLREVSGELSCQIAVVGSGPGGTITACLLAEAGRDVLLIEAGPYLQLESCTPFSREEMLQKYRNGGQTVALGRNKIAYVEGCCVGGGSEINSGLYHRTPPEIMEQWRKKFQVDAFSEDEMRPHFEACERDLSVSLLAGPAPEASLKLHQGATRLGWRSLEIPRWFRPAADGTGAGTRQSMTKTFVPRFLRAGGKLLPGVTVRRLVNEGKKWQLLATQSRPEELRIQAETVFISGGAVQTAALLRRSGIKENIGNSLRMHPTVKVVAKFPEAVNSAGMGVPVHQVKEFAPRLSFGCSISTPAYLALGLLDHPEQARNVAREWTQSAAYYAMITGEGQGTVRSIGRFRDALVRYRLSQNDRRDLADGLRKLSEILFEAGALAAYPAVAGEPPLLSRDDLRKLPGQLPDGRANLMTIHLFSSCPMGEDRKQCAANSFGRVHGFDNLFIADASLLCSAPGVNPQGSIMALARRNALHFLGQ